LAAKHAQHYGHKVSGEVGITGYDTMMVEEIKQMKLSNRLEEIFAHAVALQQSGRLRSTVFCIKRKVYILNADHTVLIRFRLRKTDKLEFAFPVSFHANDYDSKEVEERDGRICFIQNAAGMERVKSCRTPNMTPEEVDELFKGYPVEVTNTVTLHSEMLGLLDEALSHIEFSCEKGQLLIVQRNIYSGSVIKLHRKQVGGLIQQQDKLEDFEPIGIRTNDFLALFSFIDTLQFHFLPGGVVCIDSNDPKMPMRAIISKCKYDELGTTR